MKNKYFKNIKTLNKRKDKLSKEDIVYLFSRETRAPLSLTDIKHSLNITSPKELSNIKNILNVMVGSGELIFTKGEKYAPPEKLNLIEGEVISKKNGYSFIRDNSGGHDIYVKNQDLMGAILGDIVILRIIPDNPHYLKKKMMLNNKNKEPKERRGHVVRIIKRQIKSFMAVVKIEKSIAVLTPVSSNFVDTFYFDMHRFRGRDKIKDGMIVKAVLPEVKDFSSRIAEIDSIIGDIDNKGTEEVIIQNKYNLYETFDDEAMKEIDLLPSSLAESDTKGRNDLRDLPFVTIDGEDAKDFDDAVCLKELKGAADGYKLYVAIADVSHFVKPGSKLDEESFKRGNSTYFPNKVYPMLPEEISNNLCSLLPMQNRFVVVCELDLNNKGKIIEKKFYNGVIRTVERLTYNEVYSFLTCIESENFNCNIKNKKGRTLSKNSNVIKKVTAKISGDKSNDEALYAKLHPIKGMLIKMKELAQILRDKRIKNGSLDFDPVSSRVIIDENGEVTGIVQEERNFSHELIEDFMITANCAVAEFIESKKVTSLYRVHESPDEDKIRDFLKTIKPFGYSFSAESFASSKDYQEMLEKLKGKAISPFLEAIFLRSMKTAVYSPNNIHHFGLALKSYTHFTSPIRRYADLVVHRILKNILYSENINMNENLAATASFISRRERLSADAEREYTDFKKMQFLKCNNSKVYNGFITSVANFGFFVELVGYFIHGFVHVSTIADDYYEYNDGTKTLKGRHTRKIFKIGEKINVSVYSIDLLKREIDLRLII